MSSQYEYFGGGTHMAQVLGRDIKRIRRNRPAKFARRRVELKEFDEDGSVKVVGVTFESDAAPMAPRRLHELSLQRKRY